MNRIFVTGIGTNVGKTIVSAIITEALQADYWKPVQTGMEEGTDAERVRKLICNSKSKIHPETFCLRLPASPHAAAEAENIKIHIEDFIVPETKNTLVIEGAGGLMVPLNENELVIDLIKKLNAKVVLVVRHYLGSINHSLLSIEALQNRKLPVAGIIYNGEPNPSSEKAIEAFCNYKITGRVGQEPVFNSAAILKYAGNMQKVLNQMI